MIPAFRRTEADQYKLQSTQIIQDLRGFIIVLWVYQEIIPGNVYFWLKITSQWSYTIILNQISIVWVMMYHTMVYPFDCHHSIWQTPESPASFCWSRAQEFTRRLNDLSRGFPFGPARIFGENPGEVLSVGLHSHPMQSTRNMYIWCISYIENTSWLYWCSTEAYINKS